jgi:tRNA threonylcarbamoyladenosine biosynthesis protein TsaB
MKMLAMDTSGQTASVAIVGNNVTIGEITVTAPLKHAEILLPIIHELFERTGYTPQDMDAVACVCGPGSFTGLRIGAATAMGMARGAGKGMVAVPTLDSLAYNTGSAYTQGFVMPMLDARRGQIYTALYETDDNGFPRRVTEYMALPVRDALAYAVNKTVVFTGDGADAYESVIRETPGLGKTYFAHANANRQRAASAGVCALRMLGSGYVLTNTLDILYVRKPQAEREREEKINETKIP